MAKLRAVLGDVEADGTGVVLPHEHLYCDLRALGGREAVRDSVEEIEAAELPQLAAAREQGVTLLVEPTPPGIGRDPLLLRQLSEKSYVDVIAATGLYKEPLLPQRAYDRTVEELAEWLEFEIGVGILPVAGDSFMGESLLSEEALGRATDALNETPVRAGVIKLASSNEGLQEVEAKALRAALLAQKRTGVAIVSHSPSGSAFQAQLDVLESVGGDPSRFVQVHANAEKDFSLHLRALERGAWVEYDGIGGSEEGDEWHVSLVLRALEKGYGERVLISQDVVGWRAGSGGATGRKRFGFLVEEFVPRMRAAGVSEEDIRRMTVENPRRLLALRG